MNGAWRQRHKNICSNIFATVMRTRVWLFELYATAHCSSGTIVVGRDGSSSVELRVAHSERDARRAMQKMDGNSLSTRLS